MKPIRIFLRSLLALVAGLALGACAPSARTTGYLDSYENFDLTDSSFELDFRTMKVRSGPALAGFKAAKYLTHEQMKEREAKTAEQPTHEPEPAAGNDPAPTTTKPVFKAVLADDSPTTKALLFVVQPVLWRAGDIYEGSDREELVRESRERFYAWISRAYPPPTFIRYSLLPDDPLARKTNPIFVETAITDLGGGFGPARYLLGFGLGNSRYQLEGRFREGSPTGPVLAEFLISVSSNGYSQFGFNPRVFSNHYCLRRAANEIGYLLATEAKGIFPAAPYPEDWDGVTIDAPEKLKHEALKPEAIAGDSPGAEAKPAS